MLPEYRILKLLELHMRPVREKRKLLSRKMSANYEKQKHRLFLCVLSL